jgi:hypothetical protein
MTAHENLSRSHEIEGSSDRSFGLVFAGLFVVIALWPLLYGASPRGWSLGVAAAFALVALARPAWLARLNRAWLRLGLLLGAVMGPLALAILYYGVLVPIGLLLRVSGKDALRLTLDAKAQTYWIRRDPPGPPPDSMTNQF